MVWVRVRDGDAVEGVELAFRSLMGLFTGCERVIEGEFRDERYLL